MPMLSISSSIQFHQVFFGCSVGLIPSISNAIKSLTESVSFLRSTRPNHLDLLFLIIKLTGSNHNSSEFFISLSFVQYNPTPPSSHIFISVRFVFISCSAFVGQLSLPYVRHSSHKWRVPWLSVLTRILGIGIHEVFFSTQYLTLATTAKAHPPSASNRPMSPTFIYLFQWYPITSIQI